MSTASGPGAQGAKIGTIARQLGGMVRRMAIGVTSRALWQVIGHRLIDSADIETRDAAPFSGIGFYARPPSSGKPEAVVVYTGGDGASPTIVAVRDEKTRAAVAGQIAAGETMVFNAAAVVYLRADGTIEIRSASGTALALPTLADVVAIKSAIAGAAVVAGDGGATFKTNIVAALAGWPTGTTKLRAE